MTKNILSLCLGLMVALVLGEIAVRVTGSCKTYSERRNGTYNDRNQYDHENIWWRIKPHTWYKISTPEFTSDRYANSLGFPDREFEKRTDSTEIRILVLGDSYTFGDGAPADSSYPAILQGLLRARFPEQKISVFNGGTCGSDPIFGFMAYTRLLKDVVDADIVIQAFHAQDIKQDLVVRGGFERYITDTSMSFDAIKFPYEPLYKYSHLARLYFKNLRGYNEFFINDETLEKSLPDHIHTMQALTQTWADTLRPDQKFFYLLHADKWEIEHDQYSTIFQTVLDSMAPDMKRVGVIDFKHWLNHDYKIKPQEIDQIIWKLDGHHTPLGYSLMARSIAGALETELIRRGAKQKP